MKAHIVKPTRIMVLIVKPAERMNGSIRDTKKDWRWTEWEKWMNNCLTGQSPSTDWVAPRELAILQQTGEQWECHIASITKSGIYICMIRPQESPNERNRTSRSRHVNLWHSQIVAVVTVSSWSVAFCDSSSSETRSCPLELNSGLCHKDWPTLYMLYDGDFITCFETISKNF